MKNILIIMTSFFILSFLFSCRDNVEEVKTVLASDSISAFLNLPTSIEVFEDKLFVVAPFDKEGMVKVIDLKTKDICFQFAPKGEGPNEVLHVGSMDIYRDVKNNVIINLFDPTTKRLYIYDGSADISGWQVYVKSRIKCG